MGYNASMVMNFIGIASSTYYEHCSKQTVLEDDTQLSISKGTGNGKKGRPVTEYSLTNDGRKIPNEQIKEYLTELVCGDGFPYGYRKLTACLNDEYALIINHKKVYRLCKELGILQPQRVVKHHYPRRLAKQELISGPNQLWEMDLKYGYIDGTDQFFFQISLIDVFDRTVIAYHLGLSAKAKDACLVLQNAIRKRRLTKEVLSLLKVRTDNGPQFIAEIFEATCAELGLIHERIPVKTPNMNAHIESFHAILENECYRRNEFYSFLEVYTVITEYMKYYNERRRHSSLNFMSPVRFYEAFLKDSMIIQLFSA